VSGTRARVLDITDHGTVILLTVQPTGEGLSLAVPFEHRIYAHLSNARGPLQIGELVTVYDTPDGFSLTPDAASRKEG